MRKFLASATPRELQTHSWTSLTAFPPVKRPFQSLPALLATVPDLTSAHRQGHGEVPYAIRRHLQSSTKNIIRRVGSGPKASINTDILVDPLPLLLKDPLWLRDACTCNICVDVSTQQKCFQTSDIPLDIKTRSYHKLPDGTLQVGWANDVRGFGKDHISHYSKEFVQSFLSPSPVPKPRAIHHSTYQQPFGFWNQKLMETYRRTIDFEEYMSKDLVLLDVLEQLRVFGLAFIRGVPPSGTAVEDIGGRIGPLKNSFYGLTWDVKSVPEAKNVAYTNQFLGFHMDLLYVQSPPGLQLLHCIKNSCEGGSSMFVDSFCAAKQLRAWDSNLYNLLTKESASFHYDNAGEHYERRHKIIVDVPRHQKAPLLLYVNWSPPFQGPFPLKLNQVTDEELQRFRKLHGAMKKFSDIIEHPQNIYETRLQEGECVIFNNRRILHARRAFDTSSGERWLKGAYIDGDVYQSRGTVLRKSINGDTYSYVEEQEYVG